MKKVLYSILSAIIACLLTTPAYADGGVTIGRVKVIDYIIFLGIGVFVLGVIIIVLTMFVKGKQKSESYDEFEDDYEEAFDEEDEEFNDYEGEPVDIPEPETEVEPEVEPEPETIAVVDEEPEIVEVPEIEEEPDEVEVEPEPENKIRITLTGVNNYDMRIVELSDSLTIGRKPFNDIIVDDMAVSGKHCELSFENDTVFLTDLDSTNGTYINDEAIVRSEIRSGDIITIGKSKYKLNISM